MKIAKGVLILVFLVISISLMQISPVLAEECTADPVNDCTISQSLTLNRKNFNVINIQVIGNNLVLDCNQANLSGAGFGFSGILINNTEKVTVKNCNMDSYSHAITFCSPSDCFPSNLTNIFYNNIKNTEFGVFMSLSIDDGVSNSLNISHNTFTAVIEAITVKQSTDTTIFNNTIDSGSGRAITTGIIINGGIIQVKSNKISSQQKGMSIGRVTDSLFISNELTNNNAGMELGNIEDSLFINNTLTNNANGLTFKGSKRNLVLGNFISDSLVGIFLDGPLRGSGSPDANLVFYNDFLNNLNQSIDQGNNIFNATVIIFGFPLNLGNYWTDYDQQGEGCNDDNFDNICDNPRMIDSDSIDYKPLISQFYGEAPAPTIEPIADITVDESNTILIIINATGLGDLSYTIDDSRFTQKQSQNEFSLQTNFTDASLFAVKVRVMDLLTNLTTGQQVNITVNDVANTECGSTLRNSCTATQDTLVTSPINKLKDGIYISADSIIFDCNNTLLDGSGHYIINDAIKINGRSGVTLKNCNINNYDDGIIVDSSTAITLENNNLDSDFNGITLINSNINKILNNIIQHHKNIGLHLISSSNNDIINNDASFSNDQPAIGSGIILDQSNNNNITNNDVVLNNILGLSLIASSNNKISKNNITMNSNGGLNVISNSNQNIINENNIFSNGVFGARLGSTNSNLIYKNNFILNDPQAKDIGGINNLWSFNGEGNFWSDHICQDTDLNGICENPYIFQFNQDNFPFADPSGWENKWPIFISTPIKKAFVNVTYNYDAGAVDPDSQPNPTLVYSLQVFPEGMTIDPITGVITWTPTSMGSFGPVFGGSTKSAGKGNKVDVTVAVTDGAATRLQSYQITVGIQKR